MKTELFYYRFWLKSSGQSSRSTVRAYKTKQTKSALKSDCEAWGATHGCWEIADHVSYGWKKLRNLPKGRRDALKKWDALCKQRSVLSEKYETMRGILGVPPFNGTKA